MILSHIVDKIKETANIVEIISERVELKHKGKHHTGCCPFHNEKTPSFNVNEIHGYYKCFGCGQSGDVFKFLQEYEKLTFIEAIELLAERYSIDIEYDKHYTPKEIETLKDRKKDIETCLNIAQNYYHKQLINAPDDAPIWKFLEARHITRETALAWQMGYAPNEWDNITTTLINRGLQKVGVELGILNESNGRTYDKYRDRLTIPSLNKRGQLNGFVGRHAGNDKNIAKYFNPSESEVYNKSTEIFGLFQAAAAIKDEGFVYLLEGNLDVVMFHQHGIENTVCCGGTALTIDQAKLLKRYTDTVCIITDGDAAGHTAAKKWIDIFLTLDIRTDFVELPWGQDPDTWIRSLTEQISNDNNT